MNENKKDFDLHEKILREGLLHNCKHQREIYCICSAVSFNWIILQYARAVQPARVNTWPSVAATPSVLQLLLPPGSLGCFFLQLFAAMPGSRESHCPHHGERDLGGSHGTQLRGL